MNSTSQILCNKIRDSTHEDQIIPDVMDLIQKTQPHAEQHDTFSSGGSLHHVITRPSTDNINYQASLKGYLNVLELLYNSELRLNVSLSFAIGCNNGILNIARWASLHIPINEIFSNFPIFYNACIHGPLEIAQFILEGIQKYYHSIKKIGPIKEIVKRGFEHAWQNGRLDIAEWILSLESFSLQEIEYENQLIFIVCINNCINIIDILIKFRPYKLNIVFNEDRTQIIDYSINPQHEEKWLQRKLPLLAYHCNLPFFNGIPKEIVREICEYV